MWSRPLACLTSLAACWPADQDLRHLLRAAEVSQASMGQTQPHPYAGCVLVSSEGLPLVEASQWAQVCSSWVEWRVLGLRHRPRCVSPVDGQDVRTQPLLQFTLLRLLLRRPADVAAAALLALAGH